MANPADVSDVVGSFERPLTSDEVRVVPAWLDLAWSRFKKALPGIESRTLLPVDASGYVDISDVKLVLAEMVIRRLRNPDALRTWNDDTYGQTIDNELSSGKIYVTDEEKAQFALPGEGMQNGMYSMPLSRF